VGGGEELSFVEFEPGKADIPDAESQKLDKLVKALYERPSLNLEITGSFERDKDRAAMAHGKLEQRLKVLHLKELADVGKTVPSTEAIQLEPADRERLLKQVLTDLGTNQTLVLQAPATGPITNTIAEVSGVPLAGQAIPPPASKVSGGTTRTNLPASGSKGARALMTVTANRSSTANTPPPARPLPAAEDVSSLTPEQIEAKLVAAIQVSSDEQHDLIRQRAQAVQSFLLKTGKVTPDRLFIVAPKPAAAAAKGETRSNLSLD
jgi:hypothetical protein